MPFSSAETMQLPPLPYSQEAEESIVGALLLSSDFHDRLPADLRPEHFYIDVLRELYGWAHGEIAAGRQVDVVTAVARFESQPDGFKDVGGVRGYLAHLAAATSGMVGAHARLVIEQAERRRAILSAYDLMEAAREDDSHNWRLALGEHQGHLDALVSDGSLSAQVGLGTAMERAIDLATAAHKRGDGLAGLSTGLPVLDQATGGFAPGQMIVAGAGTGVGKTAFGWYVANAAARVGEPVLYVSLEMSAEELAFRSASAVSRIPYSQIRRGALDADGWDRMTRARTELAQRPISVITGSSSPARVRALARAHRRRNGLSMIVVDYLQQMDADEPVRSIYERVTQVSRALKLLAIDLEVPVIALSQLRRGVGERPALSDLRESGGIEQDADTVLLLHREEMRLRRTMREHDADTVEHQKAAGELAKHASVMEVDIAKSRAGDTGMRRVWCDIKCNLFGPLKGEETQQGGMI